MDFIMEPWHDLLNPSSCLKFVRCAIFSEFKDKFRPLFRSTLLSERYNNIYNNFLEPLLLFTLRNKMFFKYWESTFHKQLRRLFLLLPKDMCNSRNDKLVELQYYNWDIRKEGRWSKKTIEESVLLKWCTKPYLVNCVSSLH